MPSTPSCWQGAACCTSRISTPACTWSTLATPWTARLGIELHQEDARELGVGDGERVEVIHPRGALSGVARLNGPLKGVVSTTGLFGELILDLESSDLPDPMLRTPGLPMLPARVTKPAAAAAGLAGSRDSIPQQGRHIVDCENCGRTNEPGARYCAGCGVELRQEPGDADLAESRREACPNCGTANAPGVAYCAACGVELSAVPVAPSGSGSIPTKGLGRVAGRGSPGVPGQLLAIRCDSGCTCGRKRARQRVIRDRTTAARGAWSNLRPGLHRTLDSRRGCDCLRGGATLRSR